jgi:hypothetical protein
MTLAPETWLGAGGLARSTARATRGSIGTSRSRSCPNWFAADPDRLMRFEREATTLASLNHPHIAQIYGIEVSAGVRAPVMDWWKGRLPLEDLAASRRLAPHRDVDRAGPPKT